MQCIIDWLNDNNGALMVIITFIYVIATILICKANIKSARATQAQTNEMKRQFDAINCPNIVVEIKIIHNEMWVLRFTNLGSLPAYDLNITLDDDFIQAIREDYLRRIVKENNRKRLFLNGGSTYDIYYGSKKCPLPSSTPIKGTITYTDNYGKPFSKNFEINAHDYAIIAHMDSDMDRLIKAIQKK